MNQFSGLHRRISSHRFIILLFLGWLSTSCSGPAEPEPTALTITPSPTLSPVTEPSLTPTATQEPTKTVIPTATQEPTNTPLPTATPEPVLETVSLSNDDISELTDEDILSELYFFVGGGGGPGGCIMSAEQPYERFADGDLSTYQPTQEIHTSFWLFTCNWPIGEEVNLTIDFPDGNQFREDFVATDSFETGISDIDYFFKTDIRTDPIGVYTVTWSTEEYKLQHNIETITPPAPRLTNDSWDVDTGYLLFGFQPNEKVKLIVLKSNSDIGVGGASVQGAVDLQTNSKGQLQVDLDFDDESTSILVLGELSGEVPWYTQGQGEFVPRTRTSLLRQISDSGVKACRIEAIPERIANINQDVTLRDSEGEIVTELKVNQKVEIRASDPVWQEIDGQPGNFGWHWFSFYSDQYNQELIWQGYFAECEALQ